ncbi:MAG: hypothetical protein QOD58_4703 [Mycobacterium sp.]|jgi:hypothetical protein|nr:hypothetical protein [Mycobacterium sp.]
MDFGKGKVLFRDAAAKWLQSRADSKSATVDHVKLPNEHARKGGHFGVVDDPAQFLSWCRFRRSSRRRLGPAPNLRKVCCNARRKCRQA